MLIRHRTSLGVMVLLTAAWAVDLLDGSHVGQWGWPFSVWLLVGGLVLALTAGPTDDEDGQP